MARTVWVPMGLSLALMLLGGPPPVAAQATVQQPGRAQIYATVIDESRRPVLGLGSEDLVLRDGGVRQVSLAAEPAAEPLAIAIVTDGLEPGDLPQVRRAIDAFVGAIAAQSPASQVGLLTSGTSGPEVLMLSGAPATPSPGDTAPLTSARGSLVDKVADVCPALRLAPTDRLVLLAIIRRHANDTAAQSYRLTDALVKTKTALWTIELSPATAAGPAKKTALDDLLGAAIGLGGSLRETVTTSAAITPSAVRIASLLLSQYVVTYAWPDPMLSLVSITTRHDRGQVLTPTWSR